MFYTNKNFLIFDFDGVLVESNKIKNDEFYSIWFNTVDNSAIKKAIDECSTRIDIITSIYNNYFPNKLKNGYHLSFFINLYSKNVEEKIILLGVKSEMLDFLKNTNKKFISPCATNSPAGRRIISLGKGRKEPYIFTRRGLMSFLEYMENTEIVDRKAKKRITVANDPKRIFNDAIKFYFLDKIADADDLANVKAELAIAAVGTAVDKLKPIKK